MSQGLRSETATPGLPAVLDGFDLSDQARYAGGTPYPVFARLRAEAPVLFHPPGHSEDGEGFWVLSRHADIARACKDPRFSAEGGGGRSGGGSHLDDLKLGEVAGVVFAMMDNPRHDLIRHLLRPAVSGHAVAALRDDLRALADDLIAPVIERGSGDFVNEVSERFAILSMALLLGAPSPDWPRLLNWGHRVLGFLDRRTGVVTGESQRLFGDMQTYFRGLLAAKRAAPAEDLGTALALGRIPEVPGQPPLSDHEREVNANVIMVTGLEQPRNTIAAAVLSFAEHPGQWALLRENRDLLPSAIEEILRWNPPNPYNRRTVTSAVTVHGTEMRPGEKVTFWWPSANRDERVFSRADEFDIRRTPNPHLSFGYGTHFCLGDEIARLQLRLVLEALLDRVRTIEPDGAVEWAPTNKHTVFLRVPIRFGA